MYLGAAILDFTSLTHPSTFMMEIKCYVFQSNLDPLVKTVWTDYWSMGTQFAGSQPPPTYWYIVLQTRYKKLAWLLTLTCKFVPCLEFLFSNDHLWVIYKHKWCHQLVFGYVFYGVITHRVNLSLTFIGI